MSESDPGPKASSALRRKLDPRGRRAFERQGLPETVEVLLRTTRGLTEEEVDTLGGTGYRVYFATGDVLTGQTKAEQLEALAELDFVQRIEVSRTLYQERDPGSADDEPNSTTQGE